MTYAKGSSTYGSNRVVDLYFRSNGTIDISSSVVRALSLSEGDVIDIIQHGSELYLYVQRRASDINCQMARYRHAVRQRNKGYNRMYCNAVSITKAINQITGAAESWLYVGNPKQIQIDSSSITALPIIIGNNQYNK